MTTPPDFRSDCPIASTLDILGDRWTLVILRDMIFGQTRFSGFVASPEGIKRNILTDRLRRMEAAGLITRMPYQDNPPRHHYHLTRKGNDLLPVIQALARWGADHLPHAYAPPPQLLALLPEDLPTGPVLADGS